MSTQQIVMPPEHLEDYSNQLLFIDGFQPFPCSKYLTEVGYRMSVFQQHCPYAKPNASAFTMNNRVKFGIANIGADGLLSRLI